MQPNATTTSSSSSVVSSGKKNWWRRVTGMLKDRCSLYAAKSDLEVALVKATNHYTTTIDCKNVERIFASRSSSSATLLSLLSRRLRRTHCWMVAVKGLLITHGLLLLSSPFNGHLPFDLSRFHDPSSPPAFSTFVRSYFAFLSHAASSKSAHSSSITYDLEMIRLQRMERMQDRLDLLAKVVVPIDVVTSPLILEAMDCIATEILEAYGKVCRGINTMLGSSSMPFWKDGSKGSAGIRVLRREKEQRESLLGYLELCQCLGLLRASDVPVLGNVAEEVDIEELERIVYG